MDEVFAHFSQVNPIAEREEAANGGALLRSLKVEAGSREAERRDAAA
jgi:hypothetical protein